MSLYRELINSKISVEDSLLNVIADYDIYCELSQIDFEFKKSYRSPLREDDLNPSFSLFCPTWESARPEEIWYTDHAKGEKGNVFTFVKKFASFQYGLELKNKFEIVRFLDKILVLGIYSNDGPQYTNRNIDWNVVKRKAKISYASRPFTRLDTYYWLKVGVDIPLLNKYNVKSVKHLLDEDGHVRKTFGTYENAFIYMMYDEVRLYRPDADKTNKWRNTCPEDYYQGEEQIEHKDVLIITKSLKDVMGFVSFMDVDAKACQAEGQLFPKKEIEKYLKEYKKVYSVMDFDATGVRAANYLKRLGVTPVFVSTTRSYNKDNKLKTENKDISDFTYNNGFEATFYKLQEMFPELPKSMFKEYRIAELTEALNTLLD